MKKETIADIANVLMKAFGVVIVFLCGYFANDNIFPMFLFFVLGVLLIGIRVEVTKGEKEE